MLNINIKEKIDEIVEKLKNDDDLLEQFNKNPAKVIEEYVGIDLPDDKVNQLVEGIKAKIKLDKLGGALGGFLLWRRIVDVGKMLDERKRLAHVKLQQALEELARWRSLFRAADTHLSDVKAALDRY